MMKRIFWIASILFIQTCYAQEIQWQNTIGGNGDDRPSRIIQTTDGGYLLGGYSNSGISGDKTEDSFNGTFDFWVVKIDSAGNIQWQNSIGGDYTDGLSSMQQTSDGGYILGGNSNSGLSGDKTEICFGGFDYWIVKIDAAGNMQWQNTIGGSNADQLLAIQTTTDGGYILGGYSASGISGNKTENSQGLEDYWIVKTDSSGNIQWQNTIGGSGQEFLTSIQQTTDGGYILGGYSNSNISGDKMENCKGNMDYWLVKTDAGGNIQWQNTIGGSLDDLMNCLYQTTDGGYISGGYSESDLSGDKTSNSNGLADFWIVKSDAAGTIQWQKTIGGAYNDILSSIQPATDSGYILGGYSTSGFTGDKTEARMGQSDLWIVKIDTAGTILWQNSIGGSGEDQVRYIQPTSDGGYIFNAYSSSDVSWDKTENCLGGSDYWLVKITGNYNLIKGKLFIDANSNNIQNSGEPSVQNKTITEQNTGRFAYADQNGNYSVSVFDPGNFIVSPEIVSYYNSVPFTEAAAFTGLHQIDSLNDFAFQPAGNYNDVCIRIAPLGPFRQGFTASYMISYENVGTTTLSPTVFFFPDTNITFNSAIPAAGNITNDTVIWNFGPLAPYQKGSIVVTVNVDTGLSIGTLINSRVRIDPVAGDANRACNFHSWEVYTTGSYDPNDILVSKKKLTTSQLATQPYLKYIIRFQNTGNDTAFNVKILNPIDTNKLQLSTLEFVASSQPVNMKWISWERNMEFKFNNILLPDSSINEPMSHGFVYYRIKPKTNLNAGDSITNNAFIYFDFNSPVETNTAKTKITLFTSLLETDQSKYYIMLYPNPARDYINLSFSEDKTFIPATIKISDLLGNIVMYKSVSSSNCSISIAVLPAGIYFIEVINSNILTRGKFMKE